MGQRSQAKLIMELLTPPTEKIEVKTATGETEMKDAGSREIMELSYELTKYTDPDGQVASTTRGGKITMTMRAPTEENPELVHWLRENVNGYSGNIEIQNTLGVKMRTIHFEDAHCVNYKEKWKEADAEFLKDDDGNYLTVQKPTVHHSEEITISCRKIIIDEKVEFIRQWY